MVDQHDGETNLEPTDDTSFDDIESAHKRHLYDGYPDYHLSPIATSNRLSGEVTRAPSLVRALSDRLRPTRSFSHAAGEGKTSRDVLVDFEGPEDPYRPINWPYRKKLYTTVLYGFVAMGATWGSSIYSSAIPNISDEFHVANVVSTLGVTLYLFGFGTGPMIWAPLSEIYGRKQAVLTPYFVAICFAFGSATAKDFQTLMLTRFFTGFFGSAPVTNTGGVLGDLWTPAERGAAMVSYSLAVAGGPLLSPIVGGAIADSQLSWRWVEYITGILMCLVLGLALLSVDETYGPKLLVYKARRLRHETGNWALHAQHEEWDVTLSELGHKYLVRPFQLLATPIAACMATYASFVYGILYLCFAAFPIEYEEERGWNHLVGSLPYISTLLGVILGAVANSFNTRYYMSRVSRNRGRPVPEARLPPMMVGSIVFPAGMFIFGWTSNRSIFWFPSVVGAFFIGAGFVMIFQSALNYLIDTFQIYAASAVAGNTALRSLFAGVFPLFAPFMFHAMGIPWASSLIGFVAVAMMPIPFLFFLYGERIRRKSKWSLPSCD